MQHERLNDIVSLAKRRGFVYQGSEIYGGLAGTWDYGPLGAALKRNLQNLWWKMFVEERGDMYGLDSAILMNQKVWQASGHASGFNDPMVECANCKSRLRADHVKDNKCPVCGKAGQISDPKQFNMMFKTMVGLAEGEDSKTFLRPETAQGMFVNFNNIMDSFYPDLPFGIAQIGKAFRNEISPRDFLFRAREFEQMEIEYFVRAEQWEQYFEHWREQFYRWFSAIGLPKGMIREQEVAKADRAHYSRKTIDFEFQFPFGHKELYGLAYRGDYDLQNHQRHSGKSLSYRPKEGGEPLVPHVIEPTWGVDRTVLAILCAVYTEDEIGGEKRTFLKLPSEIAPVKIAVSPLLKNKPELVEKAKQAYGRLKENYGAVMYDDHGNIGKRYRRQDEIGTPRCVTIDFQTLEDDTVTVRDRDTTKQSRVLVEQILANRQP